MLATDVAPTRLDAARAAAQSFLDAVPDGLRVGAVAFNHTIQILHGPTRDHATVREALGGIEAAGSTATGDALEAALQLIADARRPGADPPPAAIVLLSDGESVRGSDPIAAARRARDAGIPVYTVALGTPEGTIQRRRANGEIRTVPVPPDRETLQRVAELSGGEAFATADAADLERVYERLGSQIAQEKRPREVTNLFAGGALLLMAGAAAASLHWFGRFL
jgi:Ca-activated chloride channel family protein